MMTLNGERVTGNNMTVRGSFRLDEKSLSGQSSATDVSEMGIKPQVLSVTVTIKKDNPNDLTRLIALARSTDADGKRTVYTIVNKTAQAGNIKKVRFTENFTYLESDSTRSWTVGFTLTEYQSVPEKIEQRTPQPAATEQTSSGSNTETITNADPQYTGFEYILKAADDALAP